MSGMKKLNKIGLDSNIFIYYFNSNLEFGLPAKKIFDKLSSNNLRAVTSIVSLIEVLSSADLSGNAVAEIRIRFSNIPNIDILDVSEEIAVKTADIRRKYGFRTPDAIQLATAVTAHAQVFITNDDSLKKFKEMKVILLKEL